MSEDVGNAIDDFGNELNKVFTGRDYKQEAKQQAKNNEQKKNSSQIADDAKLKAFKNRELSLEDDLSEIANPSFSAYNPQYSKETESLLKVFNLRRDELLFRKAKPGVSQTRFQ